MLVSQYIYTACGKNRNGSFSVFSKSRDITDEESSEIREVMMYKTLSGLPYEPSEKQIEDLFPKKFGYFFLSSGRVCLAQVCYVGRVYSDLDTRWGNYIIHAFVFEKTNDFTPYSFIEHTVFKRILTKKEWHDDPIPDELPQIEIPESGGMLSAGELNSFFNEDRKNKLKLLIEAIINLSGETGISFNDEHKNQRYWLKALSLCLPKAMQNKVSCCSHFTNTLMPGNVSSRIQIKVNRPESQQFNYAQEAQKGRYAFDFLRNINPESVKPGKYAETIVKLFSSNIFETAKSVENINKVMSTYSVNINEAISLINIYKSDYSGFGSADEIYNTILIAERVGFETQTVAKNILSRNLQINFNAQQRLNVFAFVYKNISTIETKVEIIKMIVDNAEKLGIRTDKADAFRDDLNSKANFIFANYLDYLKAEGLANYVARNQNSFLKLFLAFDCITNLPAVKSAFQARNYKASEEMQAARSIMESAFKRQTISDLDLLIKSANSHGGSSGTELFFNIIQSVINSGVRFTNVNFSFDILRLLNTRTDFAGIYLSYLIRTISNQDGFIKAYINAQNKAPDFYSRFEIENKREPLIADFCKKIDMYRFAELPLTLENLKEYFDKYYVVGTDTGLFVKRLEEYLFTVQPEKRISECVSILNKMKLPVNADKMLLPPVYRIILEAVFSISYDIIYDLCEKKEWLDKINEMYNVVIKAGVSLKQETRDLVIITLCGGILKKYGAPGTNQQLLLFFSKETQADANGLVAHFEKLNSSKSIDTFIDYYFQPVVNLLIFGATADKQLFSYDSVLERVFGKIIEKGDLEILTDAVIYGIKTSKAKPVVFLMYIFRKHLMASKNTKVTSTDKSRAEGGTPLDKKLGDIAENYFVKLSSSERKKVFSALLAFAEQVEIEQFRRYFDEFNKAHKVGFLDFFKRKN